MKNEKEMQFIIDKIDLSDLDETKVNDNLIQMELRRLNNKIPKEIYNKRKILKFLNSNNKLYKSEEFFKKIWSINLNKDNNKFIYKIKKRNKPTPFQIIENKNEENKKRIEHKLMNNTMKNSLNFKLTNSNKVSRNNSSLGMNSAEFPPIRNSSKNILLKYKSMYKNIYSKLHINKLHFSKRNSICNNDIKLNENKKNAIIITNLKKIMEKNNNIINKNKKNFHHHINQIKIFKNLKFCDKKN